jgi:hypothetical protein
MTGTAPAPLDVDGRSGKPQGRPKGAKNTVTLAREILDRKIEVRGGTGDRKISVREATLTPFAESALEGDTKSAAFLLQRYVALAQVLERLFAAAPSSAGTDSWADGGHHGNG